MKTGRVGLVVLAAVLVALIGVGVFQLRDALRGRTEGALTFVVIPADDDEDSHEIYGPIAEHLENRLGVSIDLLTVADYSAAIEAMKYGYADIARLGPFAYVMATEEADVEAAIVAILEGGISGYMSVIIARIGFEDLNGATFAFVDPASASGYQVPKAYINLEGIELGNVLFAGGHPAVIQAVANGSVDAGATTIFRWRDAVEEGVIDPEEFGIFWESDEIPGSLLAVQKSMPREQRDAFVAAMEELTEGWVSGIIGYREAFDHEYDFVREVWRASE